MKRLATIGMMFIVTLCVAGCAPKEGSNPAIKSKIRKQIGDLTLRDLQDHSVWEFALDEEDVEGQDEETLRPYDFRGSLDPEAGMFIVSASFILADGSKLHGFLTPAGTSDLGILQPTIIVGENTVGFWCGSVKPEPSDLSNAYKTLGKDSTHTFPIRYQSEVPIKGGAAFGTITGFFHSDGDNLREIQ